MVEALKLIQWGSRVVASMRPVAWSFGHDGGVAGDEKGTMAGEIDSGIYLLVIRPCSFVVVYMYPLLLPLVTVQM